MSIRIHCPFCDQHYDMDEFLEGLEVECAACSQKFTLQPSLFDGNVDADTPSENSIYLPPPIRNEPDTPLPRRKSGSSKHSGASASSPAVGESGPKTPLEYDMPRRNVLSFVPALILLLGSIIAFIRGCYEINRYTYLSPYHKSYDYVGDLIPHLHYRATLEILAETQKLRDDIKEQSAKQNGEMYFIISACLFAGWVIALAIRENTEVAIWAAKREKRSDGAPKTE